MALAGGGSVVVDSLFINAHIVCRDFFVCPCFCYAVLSALYRFAIILMRKRGGCFTLIVFLMSCGCKCYVTLPHGVVGGSAVCDCGIFWSYTFFIIIDKDNKYKIQCKYSISHKIANKLASKKGGGGVNTLIPGASIKTSLFCPG